MIISHKHKFIFVKTYKTAGTSLEVLLSQNLGENDISTPFGVEHPEHVVRNHEGRWLPIREMLNGDRNERIKCIRDWRNRRRFYNHIPAKIARERISRNIWNNYFKFCVERNPWDKIVSLYYMHKSKSEFDLSLSEFVSDHHCRNYPQYSDMRGDIIVDRVLKYESLNSELTDVLGDLGVPFDGILGVRAKGQFRTDKRSYVDLLSETDRHFVAQAHADEIEAHGYTF